MTIIEEENRIVLKGVKCFNLALTLDCGQAFRWSENNDGSWSGVAGQKYLKISQNNDEICLFNTTLLDYNTFWKNYFDFDKDYESICNKLKEDKLIESTIDKYYGIRILNQNSFEALFSFVISQQNNIKRIKNIIKRLCEKYGNKIDEENFAFPTPERLSELTVEDFEELGCGYRGKYLEKLAKDVASGQINLEKIKALPLDEAREELLKIYGVGIKVANCALLFGFQFYSAFPVDVWMKRVMEYYPKGLPKCFENYEGIAQQYLFHWARNNL